MKQCTLMQDIFKLLQTYTSSHYSLWLSVNIECVSEGTIDYHHPGQIISVTPVYCFSVSAKYVR